MARVGPWLLVAGLGPVGLAALMLARAMDANKLIGVDTLLTRLELAQTLELADAVLRASADTVEEVRSLTMGQGVERARRERQRQGAAYGDSGNLQVGQDRLR